jgi:hypothetical protein
MNMSIVRSDPYGLQVQLITSKPFRLTEYRAFRVTSQQSTFAIQGSTHNLVHVVIGVRPYY